MDLLSLFAQSTELKFYETSWFAAVTLFVFIFISFYIGRVAARSAQLPDHGWRIGLILFSIIFSTYYVAMNWPPRFGVDLKGGVAFIVDLNLDNDPSKVVTAYLNNDKDGDGKLDKEEFPEEEIRSFPRIDEDKNGLLTAAELLTFAKQNAKEAGKSEESVDNVIDQLKKRIDPSGIYEVELRALGEDQIEITIPDVDQAEAGRIFERIKKAGYLQFRIIAKTTESRHSAVITAARNQASGSNVDLRGRMEVRGGDGDRIIGRWVNVGRLDRKRSDQLELKNRPFRYTLPYNSSGALDVVIRNSATGEIIDDIPFAPPLSKFIGNSEQETNAAYERFIEDPKLRSAFYADWWAETQQNEKNGQNPSAEMQILVVEPPDRENVEGQDLVPSLVRQGIDRTGRPAVEFTLKRIGVPKFSRLTGNNTNLPLGMVLDGELLSAPNINSKIYKNGIIEGDFTSKEVQDLISILKAGQLKTTLRSPDGGGDLIDSTLGQEMKDKGFWAIGASFVLILAFLVVYYRIAGIVSCLALIINLLMILAIIMMLKQPLTLNGLAGLVLTVGMSVDANVLIFERIREELAKEATLRMAIRNGFQRATTTIVDANITTFITAFILYVIGNEQLKSFSVALMLGIVLSMLTAIFFSRTLFDLFEKKRWLKSLGMTKMFTKTKVNFIGKRGVAFVVSIIFIAIGVGAIIVRGGKMLSLDLAGGSMVRVVYSKGTDVEDIKTKVDEIARANPVDGAPADIRVARRGSTSYPDNTYYQFDSNIKTGSGKSLAEMIEEGFEGQLAKQVVQISNSKTVSVGGTTPQNTPNSIPGKNPVPKNPVPKDPMPAKQPENKKPVDPCTGEVLDETFDSDQEDDAKQDENKDEKKQDDGESEKTEAKGPSLSQNEKSNQESKEPPKSIDRSSGFQGSRQTPNAGQPGVYKTTATIKFGLTLEGAVYKKKAASLRSDFEEAAKALQFDNYTRSNIKIKSDGEFIPDDLMFDSDSWDVEITTQGSDHGDRILEEMKNQYNDQVFFPQSKKVGPKFAQKAWLKALAAMFASLIGIVAYIWVRFQRVSFGLAAVVALIHDVLVVLGAIAVSFWLKDFLGIVLVEDFKISLAVIAALLTIIGYSLNDTIVVFDRIREVRGKNPVLNGDMVNVSINQTLSRTILTSLTTFIVVAILYGAGGDAIHGFAFALVVGVIVGTYSSIFVASPVLLMLMKGKTEVEDVETN